MSSRGSPRQAPTCQNERRGREREEEVTSRIDQLARARAMPPFCETGDRRREGGREMGRRRPRNDDGVASGNIYPVCACERYVREIVENRRWMLLFREMCG